MTAFFWNNPMNFSANVHQYIIVISHMIYAMFKQSEGKISVMLELWEMRSTLSLPSIPRQFWPRVVASVGVLSMGQIELNWITWNSTVLIFKLRVYAKLNCLKWYLSCMVNWTVWNRTVFVFETVIMLNWIVWNELFWHLIEQKKKSLHLAGLFELELLD